MADSIEIELLDWAALKAQYPFWNQFKMVENLIKMGKKPQILHVDIDIDTSQATAPVEDTTDPANLVLNFAVPQQIFVRSSDAGDTSKKIDIIGQKADGTFGQFTLTSDVSDGTTAVDFGTWNFIMIPIKNDAWAGNVIIDDDGESTTVFWTCALGATQTLGIVCVPKDFNGCVFSGMVSKKGVPAAGDGLMVYIGDDYKTLIELYGDGRVIQPNDYKHLYSGEQIIFASFFTANVIAASIEAYIVIWT